MEILGLWLGIELGLGLVLELGRIRVRASFVFALVINIACILEGHQLGST